MMSVASLRIGLEMPGSGRLGDPLEWDPARVAGDVLTFVQRFGSFFKLNPRVHVLMLDGVYVDGKKAPVFVAVPPLSDPDVQQIVQTSARRIIRLCTNTACSTTLKLIGSPMRNS